MKIFIVFLLLLQTADAKIFDPGNSFFEAGGEYRLINPVLFNKFTLMDTYYGQWESISVQDRYTFSVDAAFKYGATLFEIPHVYWGLFGRYIVPINRSEKGKTGSTQVDVTKKTNLTGFTVGPLIRVALLDFSQFHVWAEAQVGVGYVFLSQEINAPSGKHSLGGSAFTGEYLANAGIGYGLTRFIFIQLYAGYVRQKTNAFTASSTSGSLYSGIKEGDRIYVRNGSKNEELIMDRSGLLGGLNVAFQLW